MTRWGKPTRNKGRKKDPRYFLNESNGDEYGRGRQGTPLHEPGEGPLDWSNREGGYDDPAYAADAQEQQIRELKNKGYQDAMDGQPPAEPDDEDYMIGYQDGQRDADLESQGYGMASSPLYESYESKWKDFLNEGAETETEKAILELHRQELSPLPEGWEAIFCNEHPDFEEIPRSYSDLKKAIWSDYEPQDALDDVLVPPEDYMTCTDPRTNLRRASFVGDVRKGRKQEPDLAVYGRRQWRQGREEMREATKVKKVKMKVRRKTKK